MKVTIAAVGRLKAGPERDIAERLLARSNTLGRNMGFALAVREVAESRATGKLRQDQEAAALLALVQDGAAIIALDETGSLLDSRSFAEKLGKLRDDGVAELVFAIGGADGHGSPLLDRAGFRLAFGPMTWPHQLARLMLIEQIYRALTILTDILIIAVEAALLPYSRVILPAPIDKIVLKVELDKNRRPIWDS